MRGSSIWLGSVSCSVFEQVSSFLELAVCYRTGLVETICWFTDFLFVESALSGRCADLLSSVVSPRLPIAKLVELRDFLAIFKGKRK